MPDNALNYQFVIGGSLVPDRPVATNRLTQDKPKRDALYSIEYEKAVANAGIPVRNLWIHPDADLSAHSPLNVTNFVIGRAVSLYGQVHDLASQDVSLRIEYGNPENSKMFDHFVNHLNRLNISNTGTKVSR